MDGEELEGAVQGQMEAADWRPFKHTSAEMSGFSWWSEP